MEELKSCPFCGKPLYIKVKQHSKPLLAPLTHAGSLRNELIDITGENYVPVEAKYCPVCGRPLGRRAAPENKICTDCSGIMYRQTGSGKIIPVDQRCGVKITPPCYQPDGDGCAYQIYGDNNDEPIDRCKACPLCYSDKVRHSSLKSKALTCEGCESEYSDEMCEHCSRAIRDDLYARRPEGSETNG